MEFAQQQNDIKEIRSRNRNQSFVITVLSLAILVAVVVIVSVMGSQRTVIVPANLTKTFWVTGNKASAEYLEQMGSFVSWLILDVSPASIDWKRNMLLSYVTPQQYGALKTRQEVEADRLKKLNAATFFLPQQIVVDDTLQSVVVRGRLRTQINGQDTTTESKAYQARFEYTGGRVHLDTFKEIPYETKPGMQTASGDSGASPTR